MSFSDIRRFSKIETEKGAPYFDLYKRQDDPIGIYDKKDKSKNDKSKKNKKKKVDREERVKKERRCPIEDAIDKDAKYKYPKPRKWLLADEERHKKETANIFICPKVLVRIPSPLDIIGGDLKRVRIYPVTCTH